MRLTMSLAMFLGNPERAETRCCMSANGCPRTRWRPSAAPALAEFLMRPQAESQKGAPLAILRISWMQVKHKIRHAPAKPAGKRTVGCAEQAGGIQIIGFKCWWFRGEEALALDKKWCSETDNDSRFLEKPIDMKNFMDIKKFEERARDVLEKSMPGSDRQVTLQKFFDFLEE